MKKIFLYSYRESHLLNYLSDHEALNLSSIERLSNIPRGTIDHFIKKRRNISEANLNDIETVLSKYGFTSAESE